MRLLPVILVLSLATLPAASLWREKTTTYATVVSTDPSARARVAGSDETFDQDTDTEDGHSNDTTDHHGHGGIHLISFRWTDYEWHACVTLTMILGVLINIYYHQIPILNSLPESCFLIVLGVVMGALIWAGGEEQDSVFKLTANLFFNILLPPIILDAAFSLYSRDFLANSLSIFVYAVIGTVANILIIGFSLYGLGQAGVLGTLEQTLEPVQVFIFIF